MVEKPDLAKDNEKVTLDDFKAKVKLEIVGFGTSEEEIDMSQNGDGIVDFAVGNKSYQSAYDFCKKQGILPLVTRGMKVELSLARNMKMLLNFTEADKKELWR